MSASEPGPPPPAGGATTLEFALTEREFVEANLRLDRDRIRRSTLLYAGLAAVWALAAWAGTLPLKLLAWMLPLTYAVNAASTYFGARYRLRSAYRGRCTVQAVARVTLLPDGYRTESGGTDLFIRWPSFSHYTETPGAYLLHYGAGSALVLPKSALSEAQRHDVSELLLSCIGRSDPSGAGRGFPVARPKPPGEGD